MENSPWTSINYHLLNLLSDISGLTVKALTAEPLELPSISTLNSPHHTDAAKAFLGFILFHNIFSVSINSR